MEPQGTTTAPGKGRGGCLSRLVRLLAWGALLLFLFQEFLLPGLIERGLRERLDGAEARWAWTVEQAGFEGFALREVVAPPRNGPGSSALVIGSLRVDYGDLLELRAGHLRRATLHDAAWTLRWSDGAWDFGLPLPAATATDEGGLRIDRLEVRSSTLSLRLPGRVFTARCSGTVRGLGTERLEGELSLEFGGHRLELLFGAPPPGGSGSVDLTLSASGTVRGRLPSGSHLLPPALVRMQGRLEQGVPRGIDVSVAGEVRSGSAVRAGEALAFEGLRFELGGGCDGDWLPRGLGAKFVLDSASAGERRLLASELELALAERPASWDSLLFDVQGHGELDPGLATPPAPINLASRLRLAWTDAGPSVTLESAHLETPELVLPSLPPLDLRGRVDASLDFEGTLGPEEVELVGTAHLKGVRTDLFSTTPERTLRGTDAELELPWSLRVRDGSLELALRDQGRFAVGSLLGEDEDGSTFAGPLELTFAGDPVLFFPLVAHHRRGATGAFSFATSAPMRFESPTWSGTLERLSLAGDFDASPGPDWTPVLWASGGGGRVKHLGTGVELRGLEFDAPLTSPLPGADAAPGRLAFRDLGLEGTRLPGSSGTLHWVAGELQHQALWQPTPNLALEVLAGLAPNGDARVDVRSAPGARVRKEDALARLLEARFGLRVSSEVELEASLLHDSHATTSRLSLAARGGTLATTDGTHRLEGVTLNVALTGTPALRSSAPARLRWTQGKTGELALGAGDVRFLLDGPSAGHLLRASLDTARGSRFWVQGFRFGPTAPPTRFQVFCEGTELAEWLDLTTSGRAAGSGRLHGRIEVELDPTRTPALRPIEGYLASDGPGSLQLEDAATVDEVLARSLGSLDLSQGIDLSQVLRDRLVGALQDFAYESLDFRLVPAEKDLTLRARAQGKGAKVPQELDLTVNFNGFGSLLEVLLDLDLVGAK